MVDGNRTVTITAHLAGVGGVIAADAPPVDLQITDDEGSSLSVSFDRTLFIEGKNPAGSGMVTRNPSGGVPVAVSLTSSKPAKFIVPASVTIPAGQASATFSIQTINDAIAQGNQTVSVTATAAGLNSGTASVILTDLQKPDLTVGLITPPTGAEMDAWIDVPILMTNQGAGDAVGLFTQRIEKTKLPGRHSFLEASVLLRHLKLDFAALELPDAWWSRIAICNPFDREVFSQPVAKFFRQMNSKQATTEVWEDWHPLRIAIHGTGECFVFASWLREVVIEVAFGSALSGVLVD